MVLFFAHYCIAPLQARRQDSVTGGGNKFWGGTQGRRKLREIGAAKLKSGGKDFRRNAKVYSGRNHKFSDQKQVISKLFLAEIANFNVFSPKNTNFFLPKNTVGEGRGARKKSGGIAPPAGDAPEGTRSLFM